MGRDAGAKRCPWIGPPRAGDNSREFLPPLHPPPDPGVPQGLQSLPLAGLPRGSRISFDFGVLARKRADPTGDQA